MCIEYLQKTSLHGGAPLVTIQRSVAKVGLKVRLVRLEGSEHDLSGHGVLVLHRSALVERLAHHQDRITIKAVFQLDVSQL